MSEQNMNTRLSKANRQLNRKVNTQRNWIIILVIAAILLAGHIVWCLMHHENIHQTCTVCGGAQTHVCQTDYNAVLNENVALQAQLEQMNTEYVALQIQWQNLQNQLNDGQCYHFCPIHCPECLHEHTEQQNEVSNWIIVGTRTTCRFKQSVTKIVCCDCGKILSESEAQTVETDTQHDFGSDSTCNDCGYTKPNGGTPVNPTEVPTVTAAPTATPVVTAAPTVAPTTAPTEEPCKHPEEYDKSASEWTKKENVGTAECCHTQQRTVKVHCKKCDVFLRDRVETRNVPDHTFSGETCTVCGYTKPCKHPEEYDKSASEWTKKENVGTAECCHTQQRTVKVHCKKCDVFLRDRVETRNVPDHTFSGETCTVCGYTKPCEHKEEYVKYWSDWAKKSNVAERKHCCIEARTGAIHCKKCDIFLRAKEETRNVEYHNFSGDICTVCGYKRHAGSVTVEGTIPPSNTSAELEDQSGTPTPVKGGN